MISPEQPAFSELHIHHFFNEDAEEGKKVNVVPRWMGGLTKREYFAGAAIQGILANKDLLVALKQNGIANPVNKEVARAALEVADALIAELSK